MVESVYPQRLKPESLAVPNGTAEAVPYPFLPSLYRNSRTALAKHDDGDQDADDEDKDRQEVDMIGKPGFLGRQGVDEERRQVSGRRECGRGFRGGPERPFSLFLFAVQAKRSALRDGKAARRTLPNPQHGFGKRRRRKGLRFQGGNLLGRRRLKRFGCRCRRTSNGRRNKGRVGDKRRN